MQAFFDFLHVTKRTYRWLSRKALFCLLLRINDSFCAVNDIWRQNPIISGFELYGFGFVFCLNNDCWHSKSSQYEL